MSTETETKTIRVKLGQLLASPWRDMKSYPLQESRVQVLVEKMKHDGFMWDNLQVRPAPDEKDAYQITAGHHRLAAGLAVFGKNYEVSAQCADFGDLDMLHHMAAENNDAFGAMPGHKMACVEQAICVVFPALYVRVPVLYAAKTKGANRVRKHRDVTGAGDLTSTSNADLAQLRRLYGDEQSYQRARNEKQPGRDVVVKFFHGAISSNDVRALLGALKVAHKIGEAPTEMVRSADSMSAIQRDVQQVKRQLERGESAEKVRTNMRKGRDRVLAERKRAKETGAQPRMGRRGRAVVMAEASGDAKQIIETLMQEIPSDLKAPVNRLRRVLAEARKLGITSIRDVRTWGNLWGAMILAVSTVASAVQVFGEDLTDAQREQMHRIAVALAAACEKRHSNVIELPRREAQEN